MRYRKVVLATNIAETSITIPGIRFVVDTGLQVVLGKAARSSVHTSAAAGHWHHEAEDVSPTDRHRHAEARLVLRLHRLTRVTSSRSQDCRDITGISHSEGGSGRPAELLHFSI